MSDIEVDVENGGIILPCTVRLNKRPRVFAMGFIEITKRSHPHQFKKAVDAAKEKSCQKSAS